MEVRIVLRQLNQKSGSFMDRINAIVRNHKQSCVVPCEYTMAEQTVTRMRTLTEHWTCWLLISWFSNLQNCVGKFSFVLSIPGLMYICYSMLSRQWFLYTFLTQNLVGGQHPFTTGFIGNSSHRSESTEKNLENEILEWLLTDFPPSKV